MANWNRRRIKPQPELRWQLWPFSRHNQYSRYKKVISSSRLILLSAVTLSIAASSANAIYASERINHSTRNDSDSTSSTIEVQDNAQTEHQHLVPNYQTPVSAHQPIIWQRRGPYFPSWDAIAPPFPEPIFPEISQPLYLVIRLSERRVYVYSGNAITTSYPIAIGKPGWETPVGAYAVINMQENPAWENPFNGTVIPAGHHNPLGDRWIGFWSDGTNMIGFHGTPNERSVGQAASHGCIRMLNQDVRELYAIAALGMPVIVEP